METKKNFWVLYCGLGKYVYEERENCWQYTSFDNATQFESLEEAVKIQKQLAKCFSDIAVAKVEQKTKIVCFER